MLKLLPHGECVTRARDMLSETGSFERAVATYVRHIHGRGHLVMREHNGQCRVLDTNSSTGLYISGSNWEFVARELGITEPEAD